MLGNYIPPFTLSFYDAVGNPSCFFTPPERDDHQDGSPPDDSHGLNDKQDEDRPPYWIKIDSRDNDMSVEALCDEVYVDKFIVPKVRLCVVCILKCSTAIITRL